MPTATALGVIAPVAPAVHVHAHVHALAAATKRRPIHPTIPNLTR
jgi:hypothetical protein